MPPLFDEQRPDYHALYDAGLLDAAMTMNADLTIRLSKNIGEFDPEAVRAWRVPWCVVPTQQTDARPTIHDYRNNLVDKMLHVLHQKSAITSAQPARDIQILVSHIAHFAIRDSVNFHGKTTFQESVFPQENANMILQRMRDTLRGVVMSGSGRGNSVIILDGPVHPEWGNFKARPEKSKRGSSIKILPVSEQVRMFALSLLGKNINLRQTTDDLACAVIQEAAPHLFSVNRDYIAEVERPERLELQKFCIEHRSDTILTTADYTTLLDLITDLWLQIDADADSAEDIAAAIANEQQEKLPSIADDNILDTLHAFITPCLSRPEDINEMRRRMAILKFLAMKSLLEKGTPESTIDTIIEALYAAIKICGADDRMIELYALAHRCKEERQSLELLLYAL